ncbi:peptidoglycan-binding protein [Streptomyces sp. 11x1]|uniref:peptidoglycan-binding domain-containing protein n=1 Tax=Streptomyces sp. 11x1 TaxID=3038642 RepID=UPI002931EC7D|nr:peptidoglycan-binding protein [Streptomyces sp. 11x1]WNZ11623.1 peptidoglycan-binding protein [Streptomyces sp. 11x1]
MSTNSSKPRRAAAVLAAAAAMLTATMVTASPAAASGTYSGRAYVYGTGPYTDDWDDEGILQRSTHASSNATCLWQAILHADGKLTSLSDIDGVFGTKTYNATIAWQRSENEDWGATLKVDGSVGEYTFTWAGGYIAYLSGSTDAGQTLNLRYVGVAGGVTMRRLPDGNYEFIDGDGAWRKAGYNYRSCS